MVHDCCGTFANCFDTERSPDNLITGTVQQFLFKLSWTNVNHVDRLVQYTLVVVHRGSGTEETERGGD